MTLLRVPARARPSTQSQTSAPDRRNGRTPTTPALGDVVGDVAREVLGEPRCRAVVIAMSKDANPKATVLLFRRDSAAPAAVVKAALGGGASASVAREASALARLATLDPDLLDGSVPRLLDVRERSGLMVLVTTTLTGTPMSSDYHRWHHTSSPAAVRADFADAEAWLGHLRAVGDGLVVHGDFWCGNILRTRGRLGSDQQDGTPLNGEAGSRSRRPGALRGRSVSRVSGVTDWEHARFDADPVHDRVRFALSYSLYLDRHTRSGRPVTGHPGLVAGAWGSGIRHAFAGRTWYSDVVARFVGAGLAQAAGDPEAWREALLAGLDEIARVSDHEEFGRSHADLAEELRRCAH